MSTHPAGPWQAYLDAEQRLNQGLIRRDDSVERDPDEPPRDRAARKYTEAGEFLAGCGDPQRAFPSVLIAGTSGKGSVATITARALQAAGLRVGLHTSPYLQVATEKIVIDGQYVDGDTFAELVDWIHPQALAARTPQATASPHGMASVAIAYEAFRRAEVDIAVIETGLGGRYDLNNHVEPIGTCVTSVGLDHLVTLGPTLADIAWHKAGIARPGVPLVTAATGEPLTVIEREAQAAGAPLVLVEIEGEEGEPAPTFPLRNLVLAAGLLSQLPEPYRINDLDPAPLGLDRLLPGRLETLPGDPVISYGAHNPEKMRALVAALQERGTRRAVVVFGQLESKESSPMVEALAPIAERIVFTQPQVHEKPAVPASELVALAADLGLNAEAVPRPRSALERALAVAGDLTTDESACPVVVTGSLYLLGEIREFTYPREKVLRQGTSWPD